MTFRTNHIPEGYFKTYCFHGNNKVMCDGENCNKVLYEDSDSDAEEEPNPIHLGSYYHCTECEPEPGAISGGYDVCIKCLEESKQYKDEPV